MSMDLTVLYPTLKHRQVLRDTSRRHTHTTTNNINDAHVLVFGKAAFSSCWKSALLYDVMGLLERVEEKLVGEVAVT